MQGIIFSEFVSCDIFVLVNFGTAGSFFTQQMNSKALKECKITNNISGKYVKLLPRIEIFTGVKIHVVVFGVMTPFSLVGSYQYFSDYLCCIYL
jgi:hypothetical protein